MRQSRVFVINLPPLGYAHRRRHTPRATTYGRKTRKKGDVLWRMETQTPKKNKRNTYSVHLGKKKKRTETSPLYVPAPPSPSSSPSKPRSSRPQKTPCTSQIHKTTEMKADRPSRSHSTDLGRCRCRSRGPTGHRGYRTRVLLPPLPTPFLRSPVVEGEEGAVAAAAEEGVPSVSP